MAAAGANAVLVVNPSYYKNSMTVSESSLPELVLLLDPGRGGGNQNVQARVSKNKFML
jgi:hypothetical protein